MLLRLWAFVEKGFVALLATDVCLELTDEASKQNPMLRDLVKCFVSNSFFPEKDVSVTMVLPVTIICRA